MSVLKTFLMYVFGAFLIMQVIQVDTPVSSTNTKLEIKAPKEVMSVLKRSCYDCHSNFVTLPWYSKVAPMSWYLDRHVDLGRKWVNFSIWETYSDEEKSKKLGEIYKAVYKAMPLDAYVYMHPEAAMTKEQRAMIRAWTGKSPF